MEIAIGLEEDKRKSISEYLGSILANEYFLYLKTLNFHWNITGESFFGLHKLLEEHYEWLKETVDEMAERIRTLGYMAPGNYKQYAKQTTIDSGEGNQTAEAMLADLVSTHEALICELRNSLIAIEGMHDFATEDMLIHYLGGHEKIAWMLRSHLLHKPESF